MSINTETQQILKEAFDEVCKRFPAESENIIMSDISLQVRSEDGLFTIYDDDDEEIYSAVVEEWTGNKDDNFYDDVAATLSEYISANKDALENLSLLKPYSFVLVDDDKETICELHLVDEQLIMIDSDSLMQNLDKDLDDFLDKLMKE